MLSENYGMSLRQIHDEQKTFRISIDMIIMFSIHNVVESRSNFSHKFVSMFVQRNTKQREKNQNKKYDFFWGC